MFSFGPSPQNAWQPLESASPPPMEVFVGRQPILDSNAHTFAYELLFRSANAAGADVTDPAHATRTVISNALLSIGSKRVLGGRKAFINFPQNLLSEAESQLLEPHSVVVEILETVEPAAEVVETCARLKRKGFQIALDDYVHRADYAPLVRLADFIKVDFRATPLEECANLSRAFRRQGIRMLAEKVESAGEFQAAKDAGFTLFQGYFFARPEVLSSREIPASKVNLLRLLRELNQSDLNFDRLEENIRQDPSLAFKLLRYINSAAFHLAREIDSIRTALVLLGEQEVRKWVSLAAVPGLVSDKPAELVITALTRARFCELLAGVLGAADRSQDLFLMGLFSLLDAMMSRPIGELLAEMCLPADLIDVLTGAGARHPHADAAYRLCLDCEHSQWDDVTARAAACRLDPARVAQLWVDSMDWADCLSRVS